MREGTLLEDFQTTTTQATNTPHLVKRDSNLTAKFVTIEKKISAIQTTGYMALQCSVRAKAMNFGMNLQVGI